MTDNEPESLLIIVTLILLALISYFLPTVVAGIRGHADKGPIFIINLFLGWSLIGWVAALAWASKDIKTTTIAEVCNGRAYRIKLASQAFRMPGLGKSRYPVTITTRPSGRIDSVPSEAVSETLRDGLQPIRD